MNDEGERAGGEEREGRLTVPGGAGVRTEEMSPGKHCENVTATLTAGQFSKRDAAGHFPLCVGDKEPGEAAGGAGTRLRTQRDVSIK